MKSRTAFRWLALNLTTTTLGALGLFIGPAEASTGGLSVESPSSTPAKGSFPVRGAVTWGDGLGAGRGHQGQDLLAKCTRPVVASQTGRVRMVDYQASGAGNYAVVRGTTSKFDYVYMHMLRRPQVKAGQIVRAGQRIGLVGSTGRSSAWHLHFEMWSRPGWYRGGDVSNPVPYLRKWRRGR